MNTGFLLKQEFIKCRVSPIRTLNAHRNDSLDGSNTVDRLRPSKQFRRESIQMEQILINITHFAFLSISQNFIS
jgi:hypothetical protein